MPLNEQDLRRFPGTWTFTTIAVARTPDSDRAFPIRRQTSARSARWLSDSIRTLRRRDAHSERIAHECRLESETAGGVAPTGILAGVRASAARVRRR